MSIARIVGRTAADRVRHELIKPGATPSTKRTVRVRTLDRDEVASLVEALKDLVVDGAGSPVQIVISMTPERRAADAALAAYASDRPLTYFRSRVNRGLVLIELDPFSDAASQRHQLTVSDRDLLGGLDDRRSRDTLLRHAWEATAADDAAPPHLLTERLEDLARAFLATEVALRPWTHFIAELLGSLPGDEVISGERAGVLISDALPALGLFRDPELFSHRNLEREVGQNRHLAQLRDPGGRELEEEDWLQRIEAATFAVEGQARDAAAEARRRDAARAYILGRTTPHRRAAPSYREWTRIFEAKAKRGLGEQIRVELARANPIALERFEALDLAGDLDNRDRDAAQRLADDDADVGENKSLLEVVPAVLRRRIERLAEPGTTVVEEPLRGLLRAVMALGGEDGVEVNVKPLDPEPPRGTLYLFVLLYGQTLKTINEASGGRLAVADELLRLGVLPNPVPASENDDGEDPRELWADLRLEVTTRDGESGLNLSWAPAHRDGLALLARVITADAVQWPLETDEFSTLLNDALLVPLAPPPEPVDLGAGGMLWLGDRRTHLDAFRTGGLSAPGLDAYATAWEQHAERLVRTVRDQPDQRERLVPGFVDVDLARSTDGHEIWMLASHPLRLRWLAYDLTHLSGHLIAALEGRLALNPENSSLFFEWLERVSPHRQPPMLCSRDRTYLPAQELGLHEQYVRTEVNRSSVGEQMDAKTASEITGIVATYLDAFPSKVDRFVLLVLTQAGDASLVDQVLHRLLVDRKTSNPLQSVELHLVAPIQHHRRLAASVAATQVESSSQRLFPRLRTLMHVWPEEGLPPLRDLVDDVDIAVVPEVLGSSATLMDSTGPRTRSGRAFNPWLDKPVHVPLASRHRTDVTIELLPDARDSPLEHWSTLNVWRRRQPVGTDAGDVDRVTLAVDVKNGLELFQRLHDVAQWVVTVDEFVGREQIDAIENPPDVILVRPGRGKNEQYTLVVSSRAGRGFVERGLARKLDRLELGLDQASAAALPLRLYDLARNTAPSVVLRAVGLGRTLEEILGIVTTRVLVEQAVPTAPGVGADWWISLDDHTEWFGGALKSRADLARICLRTSDAGADLYVDIVESKFRQSDDSQQAVRQVARTIRILRAGLDTTEERADSRFWREEIARAIDGVSRRQSSARDLPGFMPTPGADDEVLDTLRDRLRVGNYRLTIRGVACAIAIDAQGSIQRTDEDGITIIRAPRSVASAVLVALASQPEIPLFGAIAPVQEPDERVLEALVAGPPPSEPAGSGHSVPDSAEPAQAAEPPRGDGAHSPHPRLSDATLRARLQTVVDKLDELRVPVEVPSDAPFDEGPGFYLLRLTPGLGVKVTQIQQRTEDLELALGLDSDKALRTYTHRGAVVLEVPKDDSERYPVDAGQLWSKVPIEQDRLLVPIGEDISGDPVSLDFSSPDSPHLLVSGMTGSGKSVALETILRGACRYPPEMLRVMAVDPKRTELAFLEGGPHLLGEVGLTPGDASGVLEKAVTEMERRYSLMAAARVSKIVDFNAATPEESLPWWLVVLDEYADLALDPDDRKLVEPKMLRLAQKARAAGIHLILATQRPSADILNTSVRANLSAQLALRVRSSTDSQIILGGETGAEALAGKGDALLRTAAGVRRLQCAVVGPAA